MKFAVTNTLKGREYIYKYGYIIYLDQIEHHLTEIIKCGETKRPVSRKNIMFLYEEKVIPEQYLYNNENIIYGNKKYAEKLYNKYFQNDTHHIKNPYIIINDLVVKAAANVLFPNFIISELVEYLVRKFTHKDL